MQENPPAPHECLPDFRLQLEIYSITLTVNVQLAPHCFSGACRFEQLRLQLRSVCRRDPERRCKHARFITAPGTVGIQAVIAQFPDVNDGAFSIRQ